MNFDDLNGMIKKSTGLSSSFNAFSKINKSLENSMMLSKGITGMNFIANVNNKNKTYKSLGSLDWLGQKSVFQSIGTPNNMFNFGKYLGSENGNIFSMQTDQYAITKVLTNGISSVVTHNSFRRLMDSQFGIMNQLAGLKVIGYGSVYQNQFRNTFNTLGSLSTRIVTQGLASSLDKKAYSYLEDVTNKASGITATVVQQQYVTAADLNEIYILINRINEKIDSINKSEFKTFSFWMCLLGLFLAIYPLLQQKIDASNPDRALATERQITDLRNELIETYKKNINSYAPVRIAERKCKLFLKPGLNSSCLMIVLPHEKLSVINSKGKWLMVTCLDKDSLPVSGWVLKKYLIRGKN